jgi:predicted nucleic acid-binding protein
VASLARETATERVQTWLGRQEPGTLVISDWVVTELASALSIKVRAGALSIADRTRLAGVFARLRTESLMTLSVTRDHFVTAGQFVEQFSLGLCAADALHVAITADHGATLCTLDPRLAEAASALGVSTALV